MSEKPAKPLFIALKTEYFRAFERGEKTIEYRRYGPGWNERVCIPGRAAILSHGYSGARLRSVIERFEQTVMDTQTYGKQCTIAVIYLRLVSASPRKGSRAATQPSRAR